MIATLHAIAELIAALAGLLTAGVSAMRLFRKKPDDAPPRKAADP